MSEAAQSVERIKFWRIEWRTMVVLNRWVIRYGGIRLAWSCYEINRAGLVTRRAWPWCHWIESHTGKEEG